MEGGGERRRDGGWAGGATRVPFSRCVGGDFAKALGRAGALRACRGQLGRGGQLCGAGLPDVFGSACRTGVLQQPMVEIHAFGTGNARHSKLRGYLLQSSLLMRSNEVAFRVACTDPQPRGEGGRRSWPAAHVLPLADFCGKAQVRLGRMAACGSPLRRLPQPADASAFGLYICRVAVHCGGGGGRPQHSQWACGLEATAVCGGADVLVRAPECQQTAQARRAHRQPQRPGSQGRAQRLSRGGAQDPAAGRRR